MPTITEDQNTEAAEQEDLNAGAADEQHEDAEQEQQDDAGKGEGGEAQESAAADIDGVVVTLGDEPAAEEEHRAPDWLRDLRKSNREKERENRELRAENERLRGGAQPQPLGEKPTLEGCAYDAEQYEQKIEAWYARKRDADERQRQQQAAEEAQRTAWQGKLENYAKARTALGVPDFEEAESVVRDLLNDAQQSILVSSDVAAPLIYALGKNPAKAAQLAAIKDPVQFALSVGEMKSKLKVIPRKTAPLPERVVRSSATGAAAVEDTLDRLRAKSAKTGDITENLAYRRQQREKARAA